MVLHFVAWKRLFLINQETYYRCALQALEMLVAANSEIDQKAMQGKRDDLEQGYLSTPHGQPVELPSE